MGGLRQNNDVQTLWRLRGGRLETLSKYCCKILEIMNKLMNFFMNHGLIFLNTAPTPQNIVLMIVEKHILIIWNVSEKSSSNSPSVHILHHHFRGGGGSRAMMMLMTQGGVGGPKLAQSWWCNMCTLPYSYITDIFCCRVEIYFASSVSEYRYILYIPMQVNYIFLQI